MNRIQIITLCLLALLAGQGRAEHPGNCPPQLYSPLHYWAPALYRLRSLHPGNGIAQHYVGVCGPVSGPQGAVRFPCPPVTPAQYYQGTGLAYDPLRDRGAAPPPVVAAPAP